jgi:hypothetical protein
LFGGGGIIFGLTGPKAPLFVGGNYTTAYNPRREKTAVEIFTPK